MEIDRWFMWNRRTREKKFVFVIEKVLWKEGSWVVLNEVIKSWDG